MQNIYGAYSEMVIEALLALNKSPSLEERGGNNRIFHRIFE